MNFKSSKIKKIFLYIFIFLIFDFIFTNLIIKNTYYWSSIDDKYFSKSIGRIKSDIYHHDLDKNVNTMNSWGNLSYKLITNSIGFRDKNQKKVTYINENKKRIYINGDSFAEGVGYNYEDTFVGLINKKLSSDYEILNSAVTSYSPSIYYRKTKHFIDEGLEFDICLTFLDISDIPDENFISENSSGNIFDIRDKKKEKSFKKYIYITSNFYKNNFISGKIFAVLREVVDSYKRKIKTRFLSSIKLEKSFFKLTNEEIDLYKSTHIDRSMWTYNKKYLNKWSKRGFVKSDKYLIKLFNLLKKNNIDSYLIIFPNPGQILYNNENIHEKYWIEWASKNDVKLINLYKYFFKGKKTETIKKYFIGGDVHWNKQGHMFVYKILEKELLKDFKN